MSKSTLKKLKELKRMYPVGSLNDYLEYISDDLEYLAIRHLFKMADSLFSGGKRIKILKDMEKEFGFMPEWISLSPQPATE